MDQVDEPGSALRHDKEHNVDVIVIPRQPHTEAHTLQKVVHTSAHTCMEVGFGSLEMVVDVGAERSQ